MSRKTLIFLLMEVYDCEWVMYEGDKDCVDVCVDVCGEKG